MPVIQNVNELTLVAAGDMTGNKHRAGVYNAGEGVAVAGAGVYPDVIIMDEPVNTDDHVNVHHVRSSVILAVRLGGTVVDGDLLTTDASGDFVVGTSGDKTCLKAMSAGADTEIIQTLVTAADTVA